MTGRKTAIVTGASRGIGHATALRFHAEGWRVITVSRCPPPDQCPWSVGRHRLGTIEEVADLIWFLCSAQAKYITGAEIPINGGQHV